MTAPTRGSGWTARRIVSLVVVALIAIAAAITLRPADGALHLSGDGAPDVAPLLDLPREAQPEDARLEVILIRRRESLRHVPGLERLCAGRCFDQVISVFHRPSLGGLRKVVVIDITALGSVESLDNGEGLAERPAFCAAQIIRAEWAHLQAKATECVGARRDILAVPGF